MGLSKNLPWLGLGWACGSGCTPPPVQCSGEEGSYGVDRCGDDMVRVMFIEACHCL